MILVYQGQNAEAKPGLSAHLKLMIVDMTAHVQGWSLSQQQGGIKEESTHTSCN